MKLNKKISKFLVLGMLTNNIYFNSSANTDVPNRYQTLEGEYITIDNSTVGDLEEIEIFGNTVQDPDNLEDIQSVGDLYVDDDGNPILDRQGREQYKINIITTGKNLFNAKEAPISFNWNVNTTLVEDEIFKVTPNKGLYDGVAYGEVRVPFKLIKGETYTISAKMTGGASYIICWDANTHSTEAYPVNVPFVAEDILDIKIGMYTRLDTEGTFKIQIEKSDRKTNVVSYESDKIELLLPTQLQKIGDISDKLYWDNSRGRYIIEKNIKKVVLNGSENWTFNTTITNKSEYLCFCLGISDAYGYMGATNIINNKFPNRKVHEHVIAEEGIGFVDSSQLFFRIHQSRLHDSSSSSFKEYLSNNNVEIFYWLNDAELIETNITSKLKIPTYEHVTYICVETENGINPTLKVTVDRLPKIAKNAVEEAEIDPSVENISLARMYVNMLPESLYKDQLQEQLSQVFSSDITLDRESASSNLDVYIKSQNMLSMSLDTNSVTFEDYSGAEPMEKLDAVNITINSSLPYSLNAYIPVEISNADGSNKIDLDILNIRESGETTYQTFENTTDKIVLKSDCAKGNGNIHNIDLKLDSNAAHKADVYKTVIKFEAEQK